VLFALTYDPHKPATRLQRGGFERNVIIIGSVSKTFAMTGWRIGYTLGPEAFDPGARQLQSQSTSNATSHRAYAALEAMRGSMETVPVMLAEYAKRRRRMTKDPHEFRQSRASGPAGVSTRFQTFQPSFEVAPGKPALAQELHGIPRLLWTSFSAALGERGLAGATRKIELKCLKRVERAAGPLARDAGNRAESFDNALSA